jgi:hypothetical protein
MVEGMDEDISKWPDQVRGDVSAVTNIASRVSDGKWKPIDGGWINSDGIMQICGSRYTEVVNADGVFWGTIGPTNIYHVPQSACPEAFAELYEAIIRSYVEQDLTAEP